MTTIVDTSSYIHVLRNLYKEPGFFAYLGNCYIEPNKPDSTERFEWFANNIDISNNDDDYQIHWISWRISALEAMPVFQHDTTNWKKLYNMIILNDALDAFVNFNYDVNELSIYGNGRPRTHFLEEYMRACDISHYNQCVSADQIESYIWNLICEVNRMVPRSMVDANTDILDPSMLSIYPIINDLFKRNLLDTNFNPKLTIFIDSIKTLRGDLPEAIDWLIQFLNVFIVDVSIVVDAPNDMVLKMQELLDFLNTNNVNNTNNGDELKGLIMNCYNVAEDTLYKFLDDNCEIKAYSKDNHTVWNDLYQFILNHSITPTAPNSTMDIQYGVSMKLKRLEKFLEYKPSFFVDSNKAKKLLYTNMENQIVDVQNQKKQVEATLIMERDAHMAELAAKQNEFNQMATVFSDKMNNCLNLLGNTL